jgi:alpha-ketoglutarate-dependent taurine dioxygenase
VKTTTKQVTKMEPLGAQIEGLDAHALLSDAVDPTQLMALLEEHGVLVFPEIGLDDAGLLAFSRRLGEIVSVPAGAGELTELYKISLDENATDTLYVKGTQHWHIDGLMDREKPTKASLLTARALATGGGGDTQFASTYAAYEALSDEERERYADLRVVHTVEHAYRLIDPDPEPEILARIQAIPSDEHPLVWTHESGRRSLVLGATATRIVGMDERESEALLRDLLERATPDEQVYSHHWSLGDLVIWDNTGVLHQVTPYAVDSGRLMHRVTLEGTESIG